MKLEVINFSLTGIVVCLFVLFGNAAVDLIPCDKTRRVFNNSWGVITDGPLGSNYTQDSHCEWLIKANASNKFITLSFRSMGTECSYDYVFVYDGDSFQSPLLGSFSGKTEPQQVIASSGYMLILLYSDTNYVLDGFRAEFSITDCPSNCSSHGVCYDNRCVCESDWGGQDCSRKLCPDDCGLYQGHGKCEEGQCLCNQGYSGQACSLSPNDSVGNKWHWLSHSEGGLTPRAAHTAVYVHSTDSLYVFGGYNLNNVFGLLEIYDFKNSTWVDENGQLLPDRSLLSSVDPASIAKLIQYAGRSWEEKWGLNSRTSFFRNLLYTVSDNTTFPRRTQRHTQRSKVKPSARYGHAACETELGFVVFGGKLDNGTLSNDLWLYNVHIKKWQQRGLQSELQPPKLTRHSLTAAGGDIYLFGGSTVNGEFSSKLFRIKLNDEGSEKWVEIKPRGGKELDVRVVAHSTVYHASTNSLLVYGGIVAGVARFSKLSDRMFAFQLDNRHWSEIHYTREYLRDRFVPRERAFHTANILGNYLIVFGGYSHRHNKEEICYDNQMYLYHLGCHTWVNPDILGQSHTADSKYPKQQGVFAHAASIRNGNTLLLIGGYHGNVNGDLIAYTVPPMIAAKKGEHYEPEVACPRHKNYGECSADPECGWCSADESCYGRTVGANCTTNLQTTRCPGICPALGDCHSCLIHGQNHIGKPYIKSAAHKLGLAECTWCVQNARCHHKDDNYGVCGLREDSPSQMPGWWGAKGTEVLKPEECRELDRRPGLTFIKYHHPINFSQPDHVAIINATTVDFNSPSSPILRLDNSGKMVARLLGFLRPPPQWQETLKICISYCSATLRISDNQLANVTAPTQKVCELHHWPKSETSTRVAVDFESHKIVSLGAYNTHQSSNMELLHQREPDKAKVFTFEYLEPFANGTCNQYSNCLHCLTDSSCGWCEASNTCVSRLEDESISCVSEDGEWRYLTLQPSACSNCSNYISCESCVVSGLCEWWIEEARCSRRGLSVNSSAITFEQCPIPCYKRENCSSCLEQLGRCVWCEATQQCFSFSVYTSEYQFGLCREWLDQAFPLVATQDQNMMPARRPQEQCKSCSHHSNCSSCLSSLSCGWCYNLSNPISGKCVQGDFNNPRGNCSDVLSTPNAKWAYAQCPDVDECGLGLHDCHPEAICTNTDGSYSCQCRRGYIGDGRTTCARTCYNVCVHGMCQGEPNYLCKCDLGWTGDDCSINCGCNNHSNCPEGIGICEECQNWTEGEFCEFCKAGSYGNATTEQGCKQCECNGHGNESEGECNILTGICYCKDNTVGNQCERCRLNYYGDPRNGRQCYYQCEARGMLMGSNGQGISSRQAYSAPWGGPPTRECLWIINPIIEIGSPIIQLQINATDLNVTCGENAVYVYDGLPELVDMGSQSALSAVYCNEEALSSSIVESRSGQLTVHYKQGLPGEGFSAIYSVIQCENCFPPRQCKNGLCVCKDGFVGSHCEVEVCPNNCTAELGHGHCDHAYGRCLCKEGMGGPDCSTRITGSQFVFAELFNTLNLADNLEHLRKTLPRFGHSLASDRRGSLWMFGGYSLSHGPLNDIRLFDTRNSTWMQVTVESTPDAKMPLGRYFHGADIVHSKQAIFVYGGLTKQTKTLNNRTLDDFWQFDIQNQRWNEIVKDGVLWPPTLSGHTLTSYRNATLESLILIGGVSPQNGFMSSVWEYRLDGNHWAQWNTRGAGPIGIFGHTTVFHLQTNSLYVFGGYRYTQEDSELSDLLYVLNYATKTWTNLNTFTQSILPGKRFLHSAVTTDTHMYILGGRISPWNITDTLYAYSYNCNLWINLIAEGVEKVGPLPGQTYAQAMTIEHDGDAAYVIGGWGSDGQCSVLRIELPKDICALWPNRDCLKVPDCAYCALKSEEKTVSETCYRHTNKCPFPDVVNRTKQENRSRLCDGPLIVENCTTLNDCTTCTQINGCSWCDEMCTSNKTCAGISFNNPMQCPFNHCLATDCIQCHQLPGCYWNATKCTYSLHTQERNTPNAPCNASCTHFTSCSQCLDRAVCRWSTQLNECISSSYQKLYCAGGVCGLVLQSDDREFCPEPCSSFTQCASCLRHAHCGWCAAPGNNGTGVCTEGSSDRPMHSTCNLLANVDIPLPAIDILNVDNPESIVPNLSVLNLDDQFENNSYSWYYVKCPPENECRNNHHSCNPISERCEDLDEGYECVCGIGYKTSPTGCEPVCTQGCVRGQCVEPNKCKCDFGYVGANCSIQCQCNGHANCEGPDKLDKCLRCYNNTMGSQCDKCQPLYVGDPADGGQCVPCLEYCFGHSNICLSENSTDLDPPEDMDIEDVVDYLKEGPKGSAKCLRCINKTAGTRCDECIPGNFRGTEDHRDPCRPCDCHGHGDTCDPVTGEKCNCKNNTESEACPTGLSVKNNARQCYEMQCSKCKEGYVGTPKDGHQCYKQMNMDFKMCFDSKPIDECKIKPKPLHPGEMVFFMIQPRYMNVDIRVIIDVTQGKLNVYMSTRENTYIVYPNQTTGMQEIDLDPTFTPFENGTFRNDDVLLEKDAAGLRTYITVKQTKTMLAVKGLKDRLVITLPEEYHTLESTRFYLVLQAVDTPDVDKKVAYGIVFFKQDQLHIDLFVFFSVFFSCFFLFLAACVVAWKAKQAADVRRARRRHVVEMLHMAKRPFASVTLNLGQRSKPRRNAHYDLRPVAVEPTDDGLAAVATVFVNLPGGQSASVKLALGSSLILLARQFPSGGRAFLRRRSTHAAPPT